MTRVLRGNYCRTWQFSLLLIWSALSTSTLGGLDPALGVGVVIGCSAAGTAQADTGASAPGTGTMPPQTLVSAIRRVFVR